MYPFLCLPILICHLILPTESSLRDSAANTVRICIVTPHVIFSVRPGLRGRDCHVSDAGVSSLRFPTSALLLTNLSLYGTLPIFQGRHPDLQVTSAHSLFSTVPLLQEFSREGPRGAVPHPPHLCYWMAWCHSGPPPRCLDGVLRSSHLAFRL